MYIGRIEADAVQLEPGRGFLFWGVLLPVAVLVVELTTRLCSAIFFDPLPSVWHILLVLAVPMANLAVWRALRGETRVPAKWLMIASGAAIAISASYALLLLPILPIAFVAILLLGLGLLPFGPAGALVVAVRQTLELRRRRGGRSGRKAVAGAGLGMLALVMADIPATATLVALRWSEGEGAGVARAVALMRAVGDEDMLLRLSYEGDRRASGLAATLVSMWSNPFGRAAQPVTTTTAARELHYRVTGKPFNLVPPPFETGAWRNLDEFDFDPDQGGTQVGGRVQGLGLSASRIDGSISGRNVGYLEWTMEFANSSATQREARMTLLLPPGGVASRATLWVAGEPREAVVAGEAEARAAYEQVVVREARDPLLVTTDGADRLLVQAFPVQPGEKLKFRIGITAPLETAADGRSSLALPAIADRNYSIGADLRHLVWIEGEGPLKVSGKEFRLRRSAASGAMQVRGEVSDVALAAARPRIASAGAARVVPGSPASPARIMIVLDGSASLKDAAEPLIRALGRLPSHATVGLALAGDQPLVIPPSRWSPGHRRKILAAIAGHEFKGGKDNGEALAEALRQLEPWPDASILWVHGPQPVAFARSSMRLEQQLERAERLPQLIMYPVVPGPNRAIGNRDWLWRARTIAASGDPAADLANWFAVGEAEPQQARSPDAPRAGHLGRLWAAQEVRRLALDEGNEAEAIALARKFGIVTPVSGAVVLETDRDYERNGLSVPEAGDVPTVPEPETWALLAVAALCLYLFWRRRRRIEAFA